MSLFKRSSQIAKLLACYIFYYIFQDKLMPWMHLAHFVWDLMENVVWMSRTFQSAHLTASIQGYFSINVFEGENRSTKNSTLEQSNPGNVWWAADHKFFMNISNISTVGYFIRSYFREIFKPSDGCRTCMYVLHDVVRPTSYPQYCTQLFAHILYIYIYMCGIAVSTADILAIPERKETRSTYGIWYWMRLRTS